MAAAVLAFATAPWKRTMPPAFETEALRVANGALVHPFCRVSAVNPVDDSAYETPSSDVKDVALLNAVSTSTLAVPPGVKWMRPLVAR